MRDIKYQIANTKEVHPNRCLSIIIRSVVQLSLLRHTYVLEKLDGGQLIYVSEGMNQAGNEKLC